MPAVPMHAQPRPHLLIELSVCESHPLVTDYDGILLRPAPGRRGERLAHRRMNQGDPLVPQTKLGFGIAAHSCKGRSLKR